MKKSIILITLGILLIVTSCKKDRSLNYHGPDQINIALNDKYTIMAESNYDIEIVSSNERYVAVTGNDKEIWGKNIGDATVTISNGYYEMTLPVNVSLFVEPTFDFGCNQEKIKELYGEPTMNFADTVYAYGGEEPGVSMSCWRMDFYFNRRNQYYLSNLLIKKKYDSKLTDYLDSNFVMDSTFVVDSTTFYMYHNIDNQSVKCEKYYNANVYHDIGLVYFTTN